jgi:ribosomal protein L6P/L9E
LTVFFSSQPTGKLTKDLSHIAVTFGRPKKDIISIEMHHGSRKGVATLRTVRTIINNLIIGVTKGFKYKMRYVYAHFPINVNIEKNAETGQAHVEIRYAPRPRTERDFFLRASEDGGGVLLCPGLRRLVVMSD